MNTLGRSMNQINLHLVTWNRPKMTELVIRTIKRNTKSKNYRLVVLDNGSERETKELLANLMAEGLIQELHLMGANAGLEAARQWLLLSDTFPEDKFFVCIDNDCLAPFVKNDQDWLERLVELMEKYETYAAISMRTQVMIGTGEIFEESEKAGADILDFPHPGGSFRIMRVDAVRQVGGWDREATGRGSEETYIGKKLKEAGYGTAFAVNVKCLHLFGTRGEDGTDRWGYGKNMKPEETGHSDISHPVLEQGDNKEELLKYAGEKDVERYYKK